MLIARGVFCFNLGFGVRYFFSSSVGILAGWFPLQLGLELELRRGNLVWGLFFLYLLGGYISRRS